MSKSDRLWDKGRQAYAGGEYAQAIRSFQSFLKDNPESVIGTYRLAMAFHGNQQQVEAIRYYNKCLSLDSTFADAYCDRGVAFSELGQKREALASYDLAIEIDPHYAEAFYNRGLLLLSMGRPEEALASFERSLAERPSFSMAEMNIAVALVALGQFEQARKSYDVLLSREPHMAIAWCNRGNLCAKMKAYEEALGNYATSISLKPNYAEAFFNRGVVLHELRRFPDALSSYDEAIRLQKDYAQAFLNRGVTLASMGNAKQAKESFLKAIAIQPDYPEAFNSLGVTLQALNQLPDALECFSKAISIDSTYAEAFNNRGVALMAMRRVPEAVENYHRAIALKPDFSDALSNLGVALLSLRQFENSLAAFEKAISFGAQDARVWNNRGAALQEIKRFNDAWLSYDKAMEIDPSFLDAQSNKLLMFNYMRDVPDEIRLHEAKKFGAIARGKVEKRFWYDARSSSDLVKIGFVSGDFKNHPVSFFLEAVLSKLASSNLQLFAYANNVQEDDMTRRLKNIFHSYKDIAHMSDESAAQLIHSDGIEILFDLSGHTGSNRLPLFAWKPAPVQIAWLGYFATTGLGEMDYVLGDPYVTPSRDEHLFVERIKRLPETYFCFSPPKVDRDIQPLPALKNGFVTFGSFNNLSKVGNAVFALWARVLEAVEGSRLFLKAYQLKDPAIVEQTLRTFAELGIGAERLILEGPSDRSDYLDAYHRVDIALDPFPFPGGTTSVEGLWMGVPVITLKGARFIEHNGETIAHNSGQSSWIAENEDDYVRKAASFSADIESLSHLRSGLRAQILRAPLFDAERFATHFKLALQEIWDEHRRAV